MTTSPAHSAPVRDGDALRHFERIDERVRLVARSLGAGEVQYPALIARAVLEQAEYTQSFPHLLMSASCSDATTEWCLSPAVCYHTYAQMARGVIREGVALTARGRCFRHEDGTSPGVRQIEFEMREIVLLGPPSWVDESTERARRHIEVLARDLGLSGDWHVAEDPFFLPSAAGKALMQRLMQVKHEYRLHEGQLAVASVNRHGSFFGQRFEITTPMGDPVHSACIAVGLDRWWHHVRSVNTTQEVTTCSGSSC
jgi:hypothetical protein